MGKKLKVVLKSNTSYNELEFEFGLFVDAQNFIRVSLENTKDVYATICFFDDSESEEKECQKQE